ncbi:MAG: UDP-N-acetylmuramate dehydrogenase, partial [Nitrospinae bacterium]|nr:UDP-N-acetylmuramate dehydrogenase [Nitrospinota bacterium]
MKIGNWIDEIRCEKRFNESMRRYTTFHIGGKADIVIFPEDVEDIRKILSVSRERDIPIFVLGGGANLLVKDGGIRGIVLSLRKGFRDIRIVDGTTVSVGVGAKIIEVVGFAGDNGLSGLEFAAGIPGSVGGALIMNAGAGGKEMAEVVESVTLMNQEGDILNMVGDDIGFGYRYSRFPSGSILLMARLSLKEGDKREIKEKMEVNLEERKKREPISFPSAGSIFKNPVGDFAGRLIESAGLKGYRIGDAQVSEKHANFIV